MSRTSCGACRRRHGRDARLAERAGQPRDGAPVLGLVELLERAAQAALGRVGTACWALDRVRSAIGPAPRPPAAASPRAEARPASRARRASARARVARRLGSAAAAGLHVDAVGAHPARRLDSRAAEVADRALLAVGRDVAARALALEDRAPADLAGLGLSPSAAIRAHRSNGASRLAKRAAEHGPQALTFSSSAALAASITFCERWPGTSS